MRYDLPSDVKLLIKIAYFFILFLIILLPFFVIYLYQSINATFESTISNMNNMFNGIEVESVKIEKSVIVKLSEVFYTTLAGGCYQILLFSIIRLKKPYRNKALKLSLFIGLVAVVTGLTNIIISNLEITSIIGNAVIIIASIILLYRLNKKNVKLWAQEQYIPPPKIT